MPMPKSAANLTRLYTEVSFLERFALARKAQVTGSLQRLVALVECRNSGDASQQP